MIKFENIRTGEVVIFTGEQEANSRNAHMAAYLNASDLSPNAGVRGQDFGWRLSPEVVAEMEAVRQDFDELDKISRRVGIGIEDIRDFHILAYVAEKDFAKDAKKARVEQASAELEEDYRARVKAAKEGVNVVKHPQVQDVPGAVTVAEVLTTETTSKSDANVKLEVPTKKEK